MFKAETSFPWSLRSGVRSRRRSLFAVSLAGWRAIVSASVKDVNCIR
nr:MAG TPA: hypothetical protein [Microviridae sp.]